MKTALLTAIIIVHSSRAIADAPLLDVPGEGFREQVRGTYPKLSRVRFATPKSAAVGSELPKGIPTAEAVAKSYSKTLTRLTEKPKSISAELAGMCMEIPDAKKYGPHSRHFVQHYRNELAKTAEGNFPPGSVLVKEKLTSEGKGADPVPSGATGMIKQPAGNSPKTGDWQFFTVSDGKVETIRMESCAGCHSGAKRDYVFSDLPKR